MKLEMTQQTRGPISVGTTESGRYTVNGTNGEEIVGWIDPERIVACVNACSDLDTELLETINLVGDTLITRIQMRDNVWRELADHRDELLEALKQIIAIKFSNCTDADQVQATVYAAITKPTGEYK